MIPDGPADRSGHQDRLFHEAITCHRSELARFMCGYERDPGRRQELQQELLLAIWRSLAGYRADCSLRTWVYRVAHHVGARHVARSVRRADRHHVELEAVEPAAMAHFENDRVDRELDLERVMGLVHRLRPIDREVMLLYLEDLGAAAIGEVTGLSARNVATKIHRIKTLLASRLRHQEGPG